MKIGDFELISICDGLFRLDGGAMFGVVPKAIWNNMMPADDQNRVLMSLSPLLVRTDSLNVLIDTGIGTKFDTKHQEMYGIDHYTDVPRSLQDVGLSVNDIDYVLLTHLHFDHAGGATCLDSSGNIVPTFPKAQYIVQKESWEEAVNSNERTRASYKEDDFRPLKESGQLQFIEGNQEPIPGIRYHVTGGHIRSHSVIFIESLGKKAVYFADIVPTTHHIRFPYIMGYDLYPIDSLEAKRGLITEAIREEWLCVWEHDPDIAMGYIRETGDNGQMSVEPVEYVKRHMNE